MPKRYVVLKQFLTDLDRLLKEAKSAFEQLTKAQEPYPVEKVSALYRPIHSIKGMSAMVDEGKVLTQMYHALENILPPLLPTAKNPQQPKDWRTLTSRTFDWTYKFIEFHASKLELWKSFGADQDETQGLLVSVAEAGFTEPLWIPIVELIGVVKSNGVKADFDAVLDQVGMPQYAREGLVVEKQAQRFTVWVKSIDAIVKKDKAKEALSLDSWLQSRISRAA